MITSTHGIIQYPIFTPSLWTPSQLSNYVWYEPNSIVESSGFSQWTNKASSSYNLVQATTGLKPSIVANAINGLSALSFDGGDSIATFSSFELTGNPGFTVALVYKKSVAANGSVFGWGSTSVGLGAFGIYNNSSISSYAYAGGNPFNFNQIVVDDWNILVYTKTPGAINSTSTSFLNGTSNAVSGSSSNTPNIQEGNLILGQWSNYSGDFTFNGQITHFLISSPLNTTDRQKLEGYLAWQAALTVNLDSGHPYKSAAPTI